MKSVSVSIIVPVYQVEAYIEKCMLSILNQTYRDFEVIIVDDGTKDHSIQKAKKIVKNDIRFLFFEKENGGLSDARNYGISKARGKYLAFLDSDDYYHETFLEDMVNKIEKEGSDIVICDVELVNEKYKTIRVQKNIHQETINGKEAILDISILNMAQNKLYKKDLFKYILYPNNYYYEDRATTYKLFYNSEKISFVNKVLFYYLQRNNSITRGLNQKKLTDPLKILDEIKFFLIKKNIFNHYKNRYIQNYLLTVLSSCVQIANYSDNFKEDIEKYLELVKEDYLKVKNIFLLYKSYPKKSLALIALKINISIFGVLARKEKRI